MNAKAQTEVLMNELLAFAKKMLSEHAGFHPFGGYLDASAKVVHVGAQPDGGSSEPNQKVKILVESFKELTTQSKAIAFAIATDVKLPRDDGSKSDAIKFFLEHEAGYCAEVFFCYEIAAEGNVAITDTIAQQGYPLFFTASTMH